MVIFQQLLTCYAPETKLPRFICRICYEILQIINLNTMKLNLVFVGMVLSCIVIVSLGQNCCIPNTIVAHGYGENRISPNIASVYAYYTTTGDTSSSALSAMNSKISDLISSLQSIGVSPNDIITSSISVYPNYNYTNGTSVIIGYSVYESLTVIIRGIDTDGQKLASVIDTLASAGINSLYSLTYDTQDPNAGKSVARTSAWNDSASKAKQYAQLAGRTLGKAIIIEETEFSYVPYYYGFYSNSTSSGNPSGPLDPSVQANPPSPQIPIGTILISVHVIVTWQLL